MRLGQTSAVYFISRAVASLLGFGATLYLANLLGPESLGVYGLTLSLLAWLTIVGTVGIPNAITKRVSEGEDRTRYVVAGAAMMALPTCLAAGSVLFFHDPIATYVGFPVAGYLAVILVVVLASQVVSSTIQGLHLVEVEGLLSPLRTGVRSGVQIALLALGLGVVGMFVGYAVGALAALAVGVVVVGRRLRPFRLPDRSHVRNLAAYARFAWLDGIQSRAFNWVDIVVLGFFISQSLVGIYVAAWNIAQFLTLFSSSISATLFPEMSELSAERDPSAVADLVETALAFAGLFLVPGVVGAATVGDRLLAVYGPEFTQGAVVLVVLVAAVLCRAYLNQVATSLNAVDRPDVTFLVNALFVLSNLGLNVVLVALYGWVGAAVATAASTAVSLVVGTTLLRRIVPFSLPYAEVGRQAVAATAMGLVILALRGTVAGLRPALAVPLLVGAGAAVYFAVLLGLSSRLRTTVGDNVPARLR